VTGGEGTREGAGTLADLVVRSVWFAVSAGGLGNVMNAIHVIKILLFCSVSTLEKSVFFFFQLPH